MKTTPSMRLALILAILRGTVTSTTMVFNEGDSRLEVVIVPTKEFLARWRR